jgi:hypothetical protein
VNNLDRGISSSDGGDVVSKLSGLWGKEIIVEMENTHGIYTVKNFYRFFPSPAGMSPTSSPWPGIIWLVTSRLRTRKTITFFTVYWAWLNTCSRHDRETHWEIKHMRHEANIQDG